MGYYINSDSKGKHIGTSFMEKCSALVDDGATLTKDDNFQENLVVVVDNGWMAAAGYVYSEKEFKDFKRPDGRPKQWFIYKHAKELSGYTEDHN